MNLIDDAKTPPPDTVSINDIAAALLRRKWLMLGTFILLFGGIAAFTLRTPRQYEAHMKILVKNERADTIVSADRDIGSPSPGEVGEAQINTEIELLNNSNLLQQVVTKSGLDKRERPSGSVGSEALPVLTERALLRLQREMKISAVHKSNIILIEYASTDPRLAAAVLQQLADSYLEAHLRVHSTPGTYEFFRSQAARYQLELRDAESKLTEFHQRQDIVMLTEQKDMLLQKASAAESAVMQADAAVGEYADKIANTRKQLLATEPRVITQSRSVPNQYSVERLHTMLAELQNKRTQLLAKFRPDDRSVLEADQEISDTQAALERATKLNGVEQSTDVNPVYQTLQVDLAKELNELAGLEARRKALAPQAQMYRQQLNKLGGATAADEDLVRNQKEAEDNYLLYAKKTEEARIAESLDMQKIANVALAEAPTEPRLPSKPNVMLDLALGGLLAGFLSLGVAFASECLRNTVETASDLEALTNLPVLASVSISRRALLPAADGGVGGRLAGFSEQVF